jgi:serine/threonine protein kinase
MLRRFTHPLPFGKYLLLELINAGGMAEVFKAKVFGVAGFERVVAIKRIWPHWAEDEKFTKMFIDEARIAVQLTDPNIVQIFELGITDRQHYIAMEYIAGRDLRQLIDGLNERNLRLPVAHAVYVATSLCAALDYAHRKTDLDGQPMNIIHRDVSPQNVLVGYDGAVKVADFGIAKAEHRLTETQSGSIKGKFGYMSPEQARGESIDRRSDIFAVGILLHEMMTGQKLFDGASDFSALQRVRDGDVASPAMGNPDVPPELERIVLRALAASPDDRYHWASELSEDLQQFLIEDKSIFTAQRMATFMREQFADDIRGERERMEEILEITAMLDTGSPESDIEALERQLTAPTVVRERPAPPKPDSTGTIVLASSLLDGEDGPRSGSGEWGRTQPVPVLTEDTAIVRTESTAVITDETPLGTDETVVRSEPAYVGEEDAVYAETTAVVTPTAISGALKRKRIRPGVVFVTLSIGMAVTGSALLYASLAPRVDGPRPRTTLVAEEVIPPHAVEVVGTEPAINPKPAPPASPSTKANARAAAAHRAEVGKLRRAIDSIMRKQAILDGDVPALDSQRARMAQQAKRGRFAEASAAAEKGLALAKRVEVNQRFVMRKLDRFNRQFDKTREVASRRKLDVLTREITAAITRGDHRTANKQLNHAFRLLSGR